MTAEKMTKGDRDQLIRLVKARARQAKAEAKQREKVLLAEVLAEMSAEYEAREQMWADAVAIAEEAAAKANEQILACCADLGIPAKHAPRLTVGFIRKPWEATYSSDPKADIVKRAQAKLTALTETAKVMIDADALKVETALVAGGLQSDEAKAVLEAMPTAEQLMPALTLDDVGVKHWQPPEGAAYELTAPLTTADRKRRRVRQAIEANPRASDRSIAKTAGVDHKTVAKYREQRGELSASAGEVPASPDDDEEGPP
jgi:hypothetical protein